MKIFTTAALLATLSTCAAAPAYANIPPENCGSYVGYITKMVSEGIFQRAFIGKTTMYLDENDEPRSMEFWIDMHTGRYNVIVADYSENLACYMDIGTGVEKADPIGTNEEDL